MIFRHYADVFGRGDRRGAAASHPRDRIAGTGISSAAIAEHNPDAELTISDLNDAMLEFARAKVPPATRVEVVDVQKLPFPDASFDVVACQFGIMFVPDLEAAFREARRVLVPTASFTSRSGTAMPRTGSLPSPMAVLAQAFPDDPPPFYRVPFGLSDVDRLRDLAQSTGFGRVRMDVVPHDAPVASWADFADGLIVGNPVADQLRRRSADLDVLVRETRRPAEDRVRRSADDHPGADAVLRATRTDAS